MNGKPRPDCYFWSWVEKTDNCWVWNGSRYRKGYGRVSYHGVRQAAHRVAYQLSVGPIPGGLYICHKCDNKFCVNPDHLFAGTQVDNMQDWTKKGKNKMINERLFGIGDNHWTRRPEAIKWRKKQSKKLKEQIATGKRIVLMDPKTGRILGTKMA